MYYLLRQKTNHTNTLSLRNSSFPHKWLGEGVPHSHFYESVSDKGIKELNHSSSNTHLVQLFYCTIYTDGQASFGKSLLDLVGKPRQRNQGGLVPPPPPPPSPI